MPLEAFIAGAYSGAYNAVGVGLTEDGYTVDVTQKGERIDRSDAYGDTLLDFVYRGLEASAMFDCLAYKPGSVNPFTPWAVFGKLGPVGRLASDQAAAFVMTRADASGVYLPATLTATKAITPPDFNGRILYTSRLRKVPVKLQFLPFVNATNDIRFFLET